MGEPDIEETVLRELALKFILEYLGTAEWSIMTETQQEDCIAIYGAGFKQGLSQ
jgi:hypothetical protein